MTADQIFNKVFKGNKNIMTPNIIKRGFTNKGFAYELSQGEGFNHEKIYGVTFINIDIMESSHDLNKCFHDEFEAIEYINNN